MGNTSLSVKRTTDSHQGWVADMEVDFGGFGITVSKQSLYVSLLYTLFHKMGGKTVPETVRGDLIRKSGSCNSPAHDLFYCTYSKILSGKLIRKKNFPWPAFAEPVFRKYFQVSFRKNGVSVHAVLGIPMCICMLVREISS